MKFYRNHYSVEGGSCGGFSWHSSLREARQAVKEFKTSNEPPHEIAEVIEVLPTKRSILRSLRLYAGHPDNG